MAIRVAMHGGMTFQTDMFCKVKTAFEVAVMRLVNVPGIRVGNVFGKRPGGGEKERGGRGAGRGKKGVAANPARTPPQEIVGGNQRRQQDEAQPSVARMVPDVWSSGERIDQDLHAVL